MKEVNNFIGYSSEGDKDSFQNISYHGVNIAMCYNRTYKQREVRALVVIQDKKYAYMGSSLDYCKKQVRKLKKQFTLTEWFTLKTY